MRSLGKACKMHIEPGYIAPAKVIVANVSAVGVLAYYVKEAIERPSAIIATIVKTALAASFFSLDRKSVV